MENSIYFSSPRSGNMKKRKLSKISQDEPIRSITPALYTRSRNREIAGKESVLGRSLDLELEQRT